MNSVSSNAIAKNTVRTGTLIDPDFNTLTDFGIYQVGLTGTIPAADLHAPVTAAGVLYVNRPNQGENITQIFMQDYNNVMFSRHLNVRLATFNAWNEVRIQAYSHSSPVASNVLAIDAYTNSAEVRVGMCYLFVRFLSSATAMLSDGAVVATLASDLCPVHEIGGMTYNNGTGRTYYYSINTGGEIRLWWTEGASVNYDMFISICYPIK